MSTTPRPTPPSPPPRGQRSGCLTAFMVIVGLVLLLPGLCAIIFAGMTLTGGGFPSDFDSFIGVGLLVGLGGAALIWNAIRGRAR